MCHSPGDVQSVAQNERVGEFLSLFTHYSWQLRGFVRALVPVHSDAEDIFQEVSRTLWTQFEQFQTGTDFLAWARAIARFKILQYRREKGRLPTNMSDAVFDVLAREMIDSGDRQQSYMQYLNDCLQTLSTEDREMIEARYQTGQSTKHVADSVSRSVDSVYRALRRIHKVLLMCIQRRIAKEGRS